MLAILMQKQLRSLNHQGFTLLELLSVLVIMGVLASVTIHRYDLISDTAGNRAMASAISELNVREALTWTNLKLSSSGWARDEDVFVLVDTDLGSDYHWSTGPTNSGGTLEFRYNSIHLVRSPSTNVTAGVWK
jgi:prepilin-type N-terminal cleavage/methylation domain-containing protein